jgi:hypothetical protein
VYSDTFHFFDILSIGSVGTQVEHLALQLADAERALSDARQELLVGAADESLAAHLAEFVAAREALFAVVDEQEAELAALRNQARTLGLIERAPSVFPVDLSIFIQCSLALGTCGHGECMGRVHFLTTVGKSSWFVLCRLLLATICLALRESRTELFKASRRHFAMLVFPKEGQVTCVTRTIAGILLGPVYSY